MAKLAKPKTEDPRTKFKPFVLKLQFDDPDDAEHFLQGMIVAQSNNSNETIPEIIAGVNAALEEYRRARILSEVAAR